ncbi:terpene synthase family protein [Streptomyces sp. NPDC054796]
MGCAPGTGAVPVPVPGGSLECRAPISWANDVLSGVRELSWPGAINLVRVLAQERGCSLESALDLAVEMHTQETRNFVALAERLRGRRDTDPRLEEYLAGLESWVRGNQDWSLITGRYHVEDPRCTVSGPRAFGE